MPLEGGRPPPSGSPSPLPARGPPAPPPPPRSGGGGPEGVARGFSPGRAREGFRAAGRLGAPQKGGRRQGVRAPGEGGTVGRQVSTSGARAYTARCPRPGRVEWSVLVSYWVWGWGASSVGRSVGLLSSGSFLGGALFVAPSAIR